MRDQPRFGKFVEVPFTKRQEIFRGNFLFQIPFPAVTICAESKTDVTKLNLSLVLENFKNKKTLTQYDLTSLEALHQICELSLDDFHQTSRKIEYVAKLVEIKNNFANISFANVANTRYDAFLKEFQEIITDEGLCYTSNMLDFRDLYKTEMVPSLRYPKVGNRSNWTVFGYEDFKDPLAYPIRILGSGRKAGFALKLRMKQQDVDYACKGDLNGFRILLHTPDEIPQLDSHFYRLPFGVETMISVQPRAMATSDNLKHYTPMKRQCYFPGEKRLNFFKTYTQANCKLECLTGKLILFILKLKLQKISRNLL